MKNEFQKYADRKAVKENKNTASNYKTSLGHLSKFLDSIGVREFQEEDINDFIKYLHSQDLNGNTKKNYVGYISSYYEDQGKDSIAEELREYNFETAELGRSGAFDRKYVNKKEYSVLRANTETIREKQILEILWETGIRAVELSELTLERTIRDENKIKVKTAKIPKDSDRNKYRTIPYHTSLNSTLREWIDYGGRSKYSTSKESPYLICTHNSPYISPNYINTIIRRISDRAGITKNRTPDEDEINQYFPTAHSLRHSYGTYRASNGMNLEKLRVLMGHGEIEEVVTYVTMLDDDLEDANNRYRPEDIDHTRELAKNI